MADSGIAKLGRPLKDDGDNPKTLKQRKKSRLYAAKRKEQQVLFSQKICENFPSNSLVRVTKKRGKRNKDDGGHNYTLNIQDPPLKFTGNVGWRTISLAHDTGASENNICYPELLKESILQCRIIPDIPLDIINTLRADLICGAKTLHYTDVFRGIAPNLVMFCSPQNSRGGLTCRKFPKFHTSVVILHGKKYIPMEYNEMYGLRMYGLGENNEAVKYQFSKETVSELLPVGDLNIAIVGIKQGQLQYIHLKNHEIIQSPTELPTISIKQVIREAECSPTPQLPTKMFVTLRTERRWHVFFGWQHIHHYWGDPFICRVHVFFKQIQNTATGSYYKDGKKRNYVKISSSNLETVKGTDLFQPF